MLKHVEATSMLFLGAHELKHDSPAPPYWTDLSRMATLRDKFYKPTCRHCCLFQISCGIAYCSHFSLDLASFSLGISSLKLSFSWVFLEFFFLKASFSLDISVFIDLILFTSPSLVNFYELFLSTFFPLSLSLDISFKWHLCPLTSLSWYNSLGISSVSWHPFHTILTQQSECSNNWIAKRNSTSTQTQTQSHLGPAVRLHCAPTILHANSTSTHAQSSSSSQSRSPRLKSVALKRCSKEF